MNSDSECLLPPNEPAAFESLCLDLWKEIWHDPGAQKNGRSGQAQAGVDVFGRQGGAWVGVQCKQKDGLLRTKVTVAELAAEVQNALEFRPKLAKFILATSGPRDAKVQERARQITEDHQSVGLFTVDRDTALTELNLTGARLLGFERAALLGRTLHSFLAPQSGRALDAMLTRVSETSGGETCTLELIAGGGASHSVHACASADPAGQRFLLAFIDLGERKTGSTI